MLRATTAMFLRRTAEAAPHHGSLHAWYQSLVALQHSVACNTAAMLMPVSPLHTSLPPHAFAQSNSSSDAPDMIQVPKNHVQNPPYIPWTPTRDLVKRKTYFKRMRFLTSVLEKEYEDTLKAQRDIPDFKAGDVLEIRLAVPENKGKESTIRGVCMVRDNRGPRSTFRIRNHINLVGTFERTLPVYSPHIKWIKILERRQVTRTRLYYLRDKPIREYKV